MGECVFEGFVFRQQVAVLLDNFRLLRLVDAL